MLATMSDIVTMAIYKRVFVFLIFMYTCLLTEGILYLGCYRDRDWWLNRVLDVKMGKSASNTPEECALRCINYIYAGVTPMECFCGNKMNGPKKEPETECNNPCPGDDSKMCGETETISTVNTTTEITTNSFNHEGSTTESYNSTTTNFDGSTSKVPSTQEATDTVGVGIGVAVGLLCAVGAVVVIIVLRRRGALTCKYGTNTEKTDTANVGSIAVISRSYEDTVENHNYFILEKRSQSVEYTVDHYNTAAEANENNTDTDNYTAIEVTEEPNERMKDDNGEYDYTTNTISSEPGSMKPDNIYNKLKIDRPGGYNTSQPGNDYDTTDLKSRNDDVGDYNHIVTRTNGITDPAQREYDVMNGMKVNLPPSDAHDYAHAKRRK